MTSPEHIRIGSPDHRHITDERSFCHRHERACVGHMVPVVFLVLPVTILFALYPGLVQISPIVP